MRGPCSKCKQPELLTRRVTIAYSFRYDLCEECAKMVKDLIENKYAVVKK